MRKENGTSPFQAEQSMALTLYTRYLTHIPILDRKAEKQILQRVLRGDEEAKKMIVVSNLRFAFRLALQYHARLTPNQKAVISLLDLAQEANMGLVKAAEKWERGHKARFTTYAIWWCMQFMQRFIAQAGFRTLRFPISLHDRRRVVLAVRRFYHKQFGRSPTAEEILECAHITPKILENIKLLEHERKLALEAPAESEEDDSLESFLKLDDNDVHDASVQKDSIHSKIRAFAKERLLARLDPRERMIVELRFGLNGENHQTLEEIGKRLGVSRERIRQIEKEALQKIREDVTPETSKTAHMFVEYLSQAQ